jgi:hypothetical protein
MKTALANARKGLDELAAKGFMPWEIKKRLIWNWHPGKCSLSPSKGLGSQGAFSFPFQLGKIDCVLLSKPQYCCANPGLA